MIDSHCHLTYPPLLTQLDGVLSRARAVGVRRFITVGTSVEDTLAALDLAARHDGIHPTAGVHPHHAAEVGEHWAEQLEALARRPETVAVGETGLDFHYDFAPRTAQADVFRRQLEIALAVEKPVIIHCREAHDETLALLRDFPRPQRVIFHCFTGSRAQADEILARGHWLSLTGVVTFKNSEELRAVSRVVPPDRLVVETDSPYLSPEPVRNVRPNEPAHVVHVARCIAGQRGLTDAEFDRVSEANTRRFFGLPDAP